MQVNAAVYARISKDRVGAGLGVERQRQDCAELADRLGWRVAVVHTDNDISAYSGKPRPGYRALLDDLRAGRVNAVLAWHTDRLHRSLIELEEYIQVCEASGAPTHCVNAGELDLSTASGRMTARITGAVARHEVEHMIERQRSAKRQAARDGKYRGGRRAFGYLADGVTVNETEAEVLREVAGRVLAGDSLRSLADELNKRGVTGTRGGAWTGASVGDVLARPRNAALIEHHGQIVGPALWAPVLPEDTWRAVLSVLTSPGRWHGRSAARKYLGSGLYLCGLECGLPVRITGHRRGNQQRPGYRCSGRAVHVHRVADKVDEMVKDAVIGRLSQPDAINLLKPRGPAVDLAKLHTEANALRAQRDELGVLWARKVLTTGQMSAATVELNTSLEAVEARIAAATMPSPLDGLVGSQDVAAAWGNLSLDRKRAVVAELMEVTILPGRRGRKAGGVYFDPESVRLEWRASS